MPEAAVATGAVDFCLPIPQLATDRHRAHPHQPPSIPPRARRGADGRGTRR
jgi:hypothetical protein